MRCLIGGGSGFVGSALAKALRARGDEVVLVSRKGGPGRITWTEVRRRETKCLGLAPTRPAALPGSVEGLSRLAKSG